MSQPGTPPAPGLAQAYLVDQGVSLSHEEVSLLRYDDATAQLLAVKGGHVFAYDAAAAGPHNLRWMYPLQVSQAALPVL
jgi:hypothetical protein